MDTTNLSSNESLRLRFPAESGIPDEYRLPSPIRQRTCLVNGELKTWHGECQTALSPVCVRTSDGELRQIEMGRSE